MVLISVPFNCKAVIAFTLATARVAEVPLSVKLKSVLGDPAESLIVKVPSALAAPKVKVGVVLDKIMGSAEEKVLVFEKELA